MGDGIWEMWDGDTFPAHVEDDRIGLFNQL